MRLRGSEEGQLNPRFNHPQVEPEPVKYATQPLRKPGQPVVEQVEEEQQQRVAEDEQKQEEQHVAEQQMEAEAQAAEQTALAAAGVEIEEDQDEEQRQQEEQEEQDEEQEEQEELEEQEEQEHEAGGDEGLDEDEGAEDDEDEEVGVETAVENEGEAVADAEMLTVECPEGVSAGDLITLLTPSGREVSIRTSLFACLSVCRLSGLLLTSDFLTAVSQRHLSPGGCSGKRVPRARDRADSSCL